MDSNAKGTRRERELRNYFLTFPDLSPLRIPASGAGIDLELPDILVGGHMDEFDPPIAIEAKASGGDPIYLTEEEVEALCEFSDRFGASPRIAVRFDGDTTWYFFDPDDLYTTDSGSYRVKEEDCEDYLFKLRRPEDF